MVSVFPGWFLGECVYTPRRPRWRILNRTRDVLVHVAFFSAVFLSALSELFTRSNCHRHEALQQSEDFSRQRLGSHKAR